MRMIMRRFIAGLLIALTSVVCLKADYTLTFGNGDRISGNIKGVKDGKWVVETLMLGTVELPISQATVTAENGQVVMPESFPTLDKRATSSGKKAAPKAITIPLLGSVSIPEEWSGEATFGLVNISGTSDKSSFSWSSNVKIPYEKNQFNWATYYKYSESNDKRDVDNYGTSLRYRREMCKRSFIQTRTSYSVDQVKGIDEQLDQTLGYGYAVIKRDDMELNVVPGIAYQYLNQPGTEDGGSFAFNFFEDFSWKITEMLDYEQTYNLFVPGKDTSDYNFVLSNSLKTKLSESYLLKISHEYDYDNKVAPGSENYTSTFMTSIGYSF